MIRFLFPFCILFCFIHPHSLLSQTANELVDSAYALYRESKYTEAQQIYFSLIPKAEETGDLATKAAAEQGVAICFYGFHDRLSGLKWFRESINTLKPLNNDSLNSDAYYKIMVLFTELGMVDSVDVYLEKTSDYLESVKDYAKLARLYAVNADIHLNITRDRQKTDAVISKAEKYAELSGFAGAKAFSGIKRGFFYLHLTKEYSKALSHLLNSEKWYQEVNDINGVMYATNAIAECLAQMGDPRAATYMNKWFSYKDSLFQIEKANSMAHYEKLYETEKKEKANQLLLLENELKQAEINEQSRTLLIVIIVAIALVLLALWQFNRQRLKRNEQELAMIQNLQRDKERIARDLHDNVGGQLSYIIYSLDGISDEDRDKREEVAESIEQSVRSVISSLRETIWAISDANIKIQDFADKLKVYVRTLFKHSTTQIHFSEQLVSDRELNALLGLNLYRICQEILTNALKYADAKNVSLSFEERDEHLILIIKDDGVGFDESMVKSDNYGLQNIRKRASEFGIQVARFSASGKGTTYELIV